MKRSVKTRPKLAPWLAPGRKQFLSRSHRQSFNYWTKIYWATPPWITDEHKQQIKAIYNSRGAGENVDHIVPLSNPLVCGLHVPWNLEVITIKANLAKSNHTWPDMPNEQLNLL